MKKKLLLGYMILLVVLGSSLGIVSAWELDPGPTNNPINKYAVCVGVGEYLYEDDPEHCSEVACSWTSVLSDELGFDSVTLIVDYAATEANIRAEVQAMAAMADENDIIVFTFSGHGIPGFLATYEYESWIQIPGKYSDGELWNDLKTSDSENIFVFLHSCYSGCFADYIRERLSSKKNDFLVLTACNAYQLAYEYEFADDFIDYLETNPYSSMENIFSVVEDIVDPDTDPQKYDGSPLPFYLSL